MKFEWDPEKDIANRKKHGVDFSVAVRVFADPFALSVQGRTENEEQRWQTLGMVNGALLLMVAHTFRGEEESEIVRIISARKATRQERRRYEDEIG